jgi:hypothetical protein
MSLSSIIIDRIRIRYAAVLFEVANLADWLKVACSVPSASRMPRRGSNRLASGSPASTSNRAHQWHKPRRPRLAR